MLIPYPRFLQNEFISFRTMSEDEVLKIIKSIPSKSCDLDPIPTSLVLDCISVLLTPIMNNVNYCLQEGSFPSCFKTAHVTCSSGISFLGHSFLSYIQPLSVWSYLNSLLPITYMQTTHKFTLNSTLGILILVPLNWQIALWPSWARIH